METSGVDSNSGNKTLEKMLIPSNDNINNAYEILKPYFKELAEDANVVSETCILYYK